MGGFRTKKAAQIALNEALADTQRGNYAEPSRTTVREFLDEWHEGARTELALTARTNYGQIIRRNINPYLGSKRLIDVSPLDIKRWHGKLLENGRQDGKPLAVASVKFAHRILRRALADAVRWNLIVSNPAAATRVPKGAPKIRLHDLRHTMASLALEAGVHPKVVQEQLGHSAIAVTLDTYSHVPQAVRRDSADKIAGLFQ